ncbi:MAG TPA: hypothetical protein VD884_01820, partial [Ohtaekwangia sp.]|nr:hypothetical protein [Ohtaekwangia sp.]
LLQYPLFISFEGKVRCRGSTKPFAYLPDCLFLIGIDFTIGRDFLVGFIILLNDANLLLARAALVSATKLRISVGMAKDFASLQNVIKADGIVFFSAVK